MFPQCIYYRYVGTKNVIWGDIRSGKYSFRELSVLGTVLRGTVHRETVRRGNIFGELSVGKKFVGERSFGQVSVGEPS